MLVFDHLNSSLPAIFDLFIPTMLFFKLKNNNSPGEQEDVLNIPKMKTSFYGSRSVQIKSIKDWNNIIHKIHFNYHC